MKESRLFQIVYQLLSKEKVTATDLAQQFEVSVRTIYRDVDSLSSSGIPIYTTQGKNGGIQLEQHFMLSKSLLSQKEKEEILQGLQALGALHTTFEDDVLLTKLSALFKLRNPNWIEVHFSPWQDKNHEETLFHHLKKAVCQQYLFAFTYVSSKGKEMQRQVKPIRLIFKGQAWYVYAYCLLRQDFRFFKLSRMRNWEVLSEHFTDDFSTCVIEHHSFAEEVIPVSLKFKPQLAFRVYDEFSDVQKDQTGALYVQMNLPANDFLESYLLSFGDGVEVLEPLFVRQRLKDTVEKINKMYKS